MAVFKDKAVVEELFGELWTRMINETEFGRGLKENEISGFFVTEEPDVAMYVDANGPLFGQEAKARKPVVTMKMSGDTVHKFWLKKSTSPRPWLCARSRPGVRWARSCRYFLC